MSLLEADRIVVAPVRTRVELAAPPVASRHSRLSDRAPRVLGHAVLIVLSAFALVPVAWMALTSFRPPNEVLSAPLFSTHFSFANYTTAVQSIPMGRLVLNTTIVSLTVSIGQLVTGLFAAYAFARWRFRFERLLFFLVVATWLVPFQVTMLPNYVLIARLGMLNSISGVIVPQLASAIAILLLRQHIKAFPSELLDAARIDGQSSFATLWRVLVPNLAPALAALTVLLFVNQWNEYFWPLLVFHVPDSVLTLGIQSFLNSNATNYGAVMAASGMACLPIFAVYIVLQRRVMNAFVRSGLK